MLNHGFDTLHKTELLSHRFIVLTCLQYFCSINWSISSCGYHRIYLLRLHARELLHFGEFVHIVKFIGRTNIHYYSLFS
jgi:hypothetical protein